MLTTGALVSGAIGAGLVVVVLTVVLITLRPTARVYARLARGFGKWAGLEVPPELVAWAGARERRRAVGKLITGGPVFIAMIAWVCDFTWSNLRSSVYYRPPYFVLVFAAILVVNGLTGMVDNHVLRAELREASQGGELADGDQTRRRSDLIPPVLTWLTRAIALVPGVALVAVWSGAAGGHPPAWLLAGLAANVLLTLGCLRYVQAVQLRLARGPRIGDSLAQIAIDQAFAARTASGLALLPVAAALAGTTAWCLPLASRHDPLAAIAVFAAVPVMIIAGFSVNLPWSRWRRDQPPAVIGAVP
jgi:hypothetical protein